MVLDDKAILAQEYKDDRRICILVDFMLDWQGYKPEKRMMPEDFPKFAKNCQEHSAPSYRALESLLKNDGNAKRPLYERIFSATLDVLTAPIRGMAYISDYVMALTGSRSAGDVAFGEMFLGLHLFSSYIERTYNVPNLNHIVNAATFSQVVIFCARNAKSLYYNIFVDEIQQLFNEFVEAKMKVVSRVAPGFDVIDALSTYVNDKAGQ